MASSAHIGQARRVHLTSLADPELDALLREAVSAGVTPGCVALVWRDGALRYVAAHGALASHASCAARPVSLSSIYDLASLTKVLSTTTLAALALGRGELELDDRLPAQLAVGEYRPTLRDLLEHASGLEAHREFFHAPWSLGLDQREPMLAAIRAVPPAAPPRTRAIYTDLGFMLLGAWLELLGGARLDQLFAAQVSEPLGLEDHLCFPGLEPLAKPEVAATEVYDAALHGGERQHWYAIREQLGPRCAEGIVHDDNCLVMAGVAGHAGLFGTAAGVLGVARAWLDARLPGLDARTSERVVERFTTVSSVPDSTRRRGWDGPNPDGSGSTGSALSSAAYGHLGFTGTSVWIDPAAASIYILLSNRVHPSRADTRIRELRRAFTTLAAR